MLHKCTFLWIEYLQAERPQRYFLGGLILHIKHFLFLCAISASLFTHEVDVYAEVIAGQVISFEISRDGLQDKMEKLASKSGIDPESKAREMSWYQKSDENIGDQQWYDFHSSEYQKTLKTTPDKLKKSNLKHELKVYKVNKQSTEKESELLIVTLKGELRIINDQLSKLEVEFSKYLNRPQQIRQEVQNAKAGLKQAKLESKIARTATENKYEYQAHQVYLHTLVGALLAELKKIELEATSIPLQIQLNRRFQEPLVIQQNDLMNVIGEQENLLGALQLENAKKLQEELVLRERESISKHPVLQKIIQSNIQWTRDLQTAVRSINQYEHEIDKIEVYKKEVEDNYRNAEKKIKLAGLSPILGRVLREQRRNLTRNKQLYQFSLDINDETGLISLAQYQIELRQKQLNNRQAEIEQYLQLVLQGDEVVLASDEIEQIRQDLLILLNNQKQVLDKLTNIYLKDLRVLGDYEYARQQLLTQINQYEAYLDERLLWVPSSSIIDLNYPLDVYQSVLWFSSPARWLQLGHDLLITIKSKLFISLFSLIFLVFLLYINPYIRKQISVIREKVGKPYTDKIFYTFQALLFNIILILPIPLILFYISWVLSLFPFEDEFSRSIGVGFHYTAVVILILQFFSHILEIQGIAELHFRWQKKTVCLVRRQLVWMQFLIIPSIFIINMTSAIHVAEHSDSLGRLALIVFMSVLLVFAVKVFQPEKGILDNYFKANTDLWWAKLRYLWLFVFISISVIIVGFSIMGYYISALELQQKIIITLRMIFIAMIVHSIIIRWLGLTRRELALKNSRQMGKIDELNAQLSDKSNTDTIVVTDEELLDISKINEQTEKIVIVLISTLLLVSFWLIWQNILPAFSFIDNIVLWQHIVIINGQETIQAITLTNLFFAGLYIFLISIATINFPGVMEVLVFRNLEIAAGSRYAINQLAKYSLITIGFISVANELGGSWGQVQWLVAALTVGLGFGLQEIFANMVSGIILLFERPIRVGDTVTVDNITGRVTRIQMRATTIIDWNNKELIVPNKTFITSQLVNWTLTDPVTRIVIPLGISYGSDIDLAYRTISETVSSTPLVLKDPQPSIYFIGFGDSSLDFTIRVYVNELSDRMPVTHDIHVRLIAALRKQNIEIPFPQQDIHVRSLSADFPGKIRS